MSLSVRALDSDEAKASLMDAALFIGLPRSEAIATIGSGFGAGMRAPRQPTARIGTILSAGQLKAAPSPSCADGLRDARSTRISDIVHGLWMGSRAAEGTPTETYLQQARGIPVTTPTMLRFHPRVWHAEANGHCPAMLGAVVIAGHGMTGFTITHLRPDGGAKADVQPNRRMLGQVKGGGLAFANRRRRHIAGRGGCRNRPKRPSSNRAAGSGGPVSIFPSPPHLAK